MKRMMKRALLCITLALSSMGIGKAQWVVSDPTNFFGNLTNTTSELTQAWKEFGLSTKQFEFLQKTYEKVSPYVKTYYQLENAYRMVLDLKNYSVNSVNKLARDPYLKPDEVVRIVRLNTMYVKYATRELKELAASIKDLGGTEHERVERIDRKTELMEELRAQLDEEMRRVAMISYERRQKEATNEYMKITCGY
ncbi:DUF4141 domain-containing protein [Porphyromonas somerae]|uniref:DUF4141 domain-containing protein n=1 Tax=Porphyromonas somerae TaxID=322095 RepID=UPI001FCADBDE|nr:DUF4141 domain-containing protein [Porphyromonas somerae]